MDLLFEAEKHTFKQIDNVKKSQFLRYESLLNLTKCIFFRKMQFWSPVSYQALFKLSIYKKTAAYLSGANILCFARFAISVPSLYEGQSKITEPYLITV